MESKFDLEMKAHGIVQETLDILKEEGVATTEVFMCLRPEHFNRLLEETHVQIGQHALLMKAFDDFKSVSLVSVHTYILQALTIVHCIIIIWNELLTCHCNVTTWKQRVK